MRMTIQTAVSMLTKVKSVQEWNQVRDRVKSAVVRSGPAGSYSTEGAQTWLKEYVPSIDGSGLITAVLGRDPIKQKQNRQ